MFHSISHMPNQPDQGDENWSRNVDIYSVQIWPRFRWKFLFMAPTYEKMRGVAIDAFFNAPFCPDKKNKIGGEKKSQFFFCDFRICPKSQSCSFTFSSQCLLQPDLRHNFIVLRLFLEFPNSSQVILLVSAYPPPFPLPPIPSLAWLETALKMASFRR